VAQTITSPCLAKPVQNQCLETLCALEGRIIRNQTGRTGLYGRRGLLSIRGLQTMGGAQARRKIRDLPPNLIMPPFEAWVACKATRASRGITIWFFADRVTSAIALHFSKT
jgi:hypothetical protein